MGFLGFGKKKKVLDLTEGYKKQIERAEQARVSKKNPSGSSGNGPFSFFDSQTADSSSSGETLDLSSAEEKKKKLAARIMQMTEKMEDLSNQIYHLQQRLEVLERKTDLKRD